MATTSQHPITPALYRQRLTLIAAVLIVAQVMYLIMAWLMVNTGFHAPPHASSQQPLIIGCFVVGVLAVVASFPAVRIAARRIPPPDDVLKTALGLGQLFFIGFAFSQTAALAGLFLFFLTGNFLNLTILVVLAIVSIGIHFLRLKRTLDALIKAQP